MGLNAWYKLNEYPANFNFIEFLVAAATAGATNVVFDDTRGIKPKYSEDATKRRIESILEPACALAGMTYSWGKVTEPFIDPGYQVDKMISAFRKYGHIKKLKSVLPPGKAKYTVTLRNYGRKVHRNCNVEQWTRLAKEIGAVVIDDYDQKPIHLHERMALYAGAEMNFAFGGGPLMCAMCSDYPYAVLIEEALGEEVHKKIEWGKLNPQFPWALPNQKSFWAKDTEKNIREVYRWAQSVCPDMP